MANRSFTLCVYFCMCAYQVEYSHSVNELASRMLQVVSVELPWLRLVLPKGVFGMCGRALVTLNFSSALHRDRRDKVGGDEQRAIDELVKKLGEQESRSVVEDLALQNSSMLSPTASAPTGCAWQLRAPKDWEIFTAFIYPGGYVRIVNKCSQVFFADKVDHATSVPVAINASKGTVRVLGRHRCEGGFGVVAWGIGSKT